MLSESYRLLADGSQIVHLIKTHEGVKSRHLRSLNIIIIFLTRFYQFPRIPY